jgi:hypothetical protein
MIYRVMFEGNGRTMLMVIDDGEHLAIHPGCTAEDALTELGERLRRDMPHAFRTHDHEPVTLTIEP